MTRIKSDYNRARFLREGRGGHYESWFVRGNHPSERKAVWIRYTIFSPREKPENTIGELWAIYFDGEKNAHSVSKSEFPIDVCEFGAEPLSVKIGDSVLSDVHLIGKAGNTKGKEDCFWDLKLSGENEPLFLFPENLYEGGFPKAKVLVGNPLVRISGKLLLGDMNVSISDWTGSHNHNWGSKHTDRYAWGQVAGFDGEPDSFLELATANLKIGPFWTPSITPIVLRFRGKDYKLNHPLKSFGRAKYGYFDWSFSASSEEIQLEGRIRAKRDDFACLRYRNPPGGWKYCLNSKIADAELSLKRKEDISFLKLFSSGKAAFEILTEDASHGLTPEA
ncbi:hypothetical protein EHQ12_09930 [Leptospira gomenensis]|uniref:Tocopherol cyclase n=1 Tax=Leptospira gomenensis TaxID=2484974 RepID=A0A5F1Z1M7_9LEPT|nr:hypothetical protein [Leptospira gomenensis]TGK34655.1 hypothetical protein EHQ17_09605 [Leptospira gomenensis]TGK38538.1 hypothetical protein EHQ12_09930 [Leptospira gomenensis]TGK51048.1 hypothetical protein EHQ07_04110 [Leptospira gomenensis]TGK68311.1 hypothetical protein EHQ13_00785 [Leptospira gomenensis]